jgi:hypothetical protein
MLCNLKAAETYFQAAFRVQSAWTRPNPDGLDPGREQIEKARCLVIDFEPARALRLYAEYGARLSDSADAEQAVQDLTRFLPVLAYDGPGFHEVEVGEILDTVMRSASIDARRMDSLRFINTQAIDPARLDSGVRDIIGRLRAGNRGSIGIGLENLLGREAALGPPTRTQDATANPGARDEKTDEDEVEEVDIAARLVFLTKRLNAFMYLSTERVKTLEDVLATDELELFEQVMHVTPAELRALFDARLFKEPSVRLSISQFSRVERGTLDAYAAHSLIAAVTGAEGVDGQDNG